MPGSRCHCSCHCGSHADALALRREGRWALADAYERAGELEELRGVDVTSAVAAATACTACARWHVAVLSGRPAELDPPPRRLPAPPPAAFDYGAGADVDETGG